MSNDDRSVPPEYFAAMYRRDPDPWRMASSDYEHGKYQATIALLPSRRFCNALEIGCSIGVLSNLLADRADRLVAVDLDELPLARARETCRAHKNIAFEKMIVPSQWPGGSFDLIVLSEVLYFLARKDIEAVARRAVDSGSPDVVVLLVNWLGNTDTARDGNAAAAEFIAAARPELTPSVYRATPNYRMDMLVLSGCSH